MLINIPMDVLERAISAFGCVADEAASSYVHDQAENDAATLKKLRDDAIQAAKFQAMFDEGDHE